MYSFYKGGSTSLPACSIALMILATVAVLGRLISRHISAAKFWWDDVLTIISLLNAYVVHVIALIDNHHGVGEHIETIAINQKKALLQMIYGSQIHYPSSISTIKLAVLLFYFRLFGTRKGFRMTIYATGTLVVVWFFAETFKAVFRCSPISVAFIPDAVYQNHHCISTKAWYIPMSLIDVLLDAWILVLPLFFVWTLQLSSRRKAGLIGIFMLGTFTIGASVARACSVFSFDLSDITWSTGSITFWSMVEVSIGVTCACLPTLPPVLAVLGRKLSDTAAFWSKRISKSKDIELCCSESAVGQKGGMTPESQKRNAALQLTLGNASWRALDYKGFELDNELKEVGIEPCITVV